MTATFQLDTSGVVYDNRHGEIAGRARTEWSDLSPFTQGYIEALFASSWGDIGGTHFLTTREVKDFGYADLAPETLARIIADCEAFAWNFDLLGEAVSIRTDARGMPWDDLSLEKAGRSFWMSRQNPHAGFADGGWPEPYARGLLSRARRFPPLTVTLGDDGKVRFQ